MIDASQNIKTTKTDDLILQRIRLRAQRRIAWLRRLWTDAGTQQNGNEQFNIHAELDGSLLNTDAPELEQEWFAEHTALKSLNKELKTTEKKIREDRQSRLYMLCQIFKLKEEEKDLIQACMAQHLDPNLGRVYAYLHDHTARAYVTRQLIARLFSHGRSLALGSSSPLFVWGLINETDPGRGEPSRLDCDPFIRNWLLGGDDLDPNLVAIAKRQSYHPPLRNWPVKKTAERIKALQQQNKHQPIRLFVAGAEGTGRKSFAAAVSRKLGKSLLSIRARHLSTDNWPLIYMLAQRQAMLNDEALLWQGDFIYNNDWPMHIPPVSIQFVVGEPEDPVNPHEQMVDLRIELPALLEEEAFRLGKHLIPAAETWSEQDWMRVIRRHQLNIGQLTAVSKKGINQVNELPEAIRSLSRQRLGELAQLTSSSFSWKDLIVPDYLQQALDDLYFEATERRQLWENEAIKKLFPQGRGLLALFSGSPGTGKTMAAQVIANNLGLDLFRIDLSAIVSKYVGETSKNIDRILKRASRMDVLLLFDEADSLFGKRTEIKDAHDRFANTDTNYLLQAIEDYPGMAILASNRKANIDTGFIRRLRYVLDFPKPDQLHRLRLWRVLIAELTEEEQADKLDNDLMKLAGMVEVTGAQIKLSILSALFMARRDQAEVHAGHLLKGLERELMKESRVMPREGQEMMKQHFAAFV